MPKSSACPTPEPSLRDGALIALQTVLKQHQLSSVFQPIVALSSGNIIGHEGLIRGPSNSFLHSPLNLFETAERFGLLLETDRACRRATVERFAQFALPTKLFLNVSPDSMIQPEFQPEEILRVLAERRLSPEQIVIELTETRPMLDFGVLRDAVSLYRSMGFSIAIDDLGEGFASLRMWSELRPDYVKIDKHFIEGIHLDPVKQQFVSAIQRLAAGVHAQTVAEGIETPEELKVVAQLGVHCMQGYFLGRPEAAPRTQLSMPAEDALGALKSNGHGRNLLSQSSQTALQLLRDNPHVSPDMPSEEAYSRFASNPRLYAMVVVGNTGEPMGLLRRSDLLENFARPFSRELYGKKPCTTLMDRQPLIVDQTMSLSALSQLMVAADRRYLIDGFIITDNGRYLGMGTGHDLMRAISEIQISAARYANPLTLLPGNVPINEQIDQLLTNNTPFVAVFGDLNHFKPFNDTYGYRLGDDVIQLLGKTLTAHADPAADFVGHVGGDDFILLFQSLDWEARCQRILAEFERDIAPFFHAEHHETGGYMVQDRQGKETLYPLVSLSLAAVRASRQRFPSHHELAATLADVKKAAKRVGGYALQMDRRLGGESP